MPARTMEHFRVPYVGIEEFLEAQFAPRLFIGGAEIGTKTMGNVLRPGSFRIWKRVAGHLFLTLSATVSAVRRALVTSCLEVRSSYSYWKVGRQDF